MTKSESVNRDKALLVAQIAHEANRAYCMSIGDYSQPSWDLAEEWQKESAIAGVYYQLNNPDSTPRHSHESWYQFKLDAGWSYGPEKDPVNKKHPCMVPYDELPEEQRLKDSIFLSVVRGSLAVLKYRTVF